MLEAMRALAIDHLANKLHAGYEVNREEWYTDLRLNHPDQLYQFLVESEGKIERVYVLEVESPDCVRLVELEIVERGHGCSSEQIPFIKPTGAQSPQVGPVFKRSYSSSAGAGPSVKILNTTMNSFIAIAESGQPWSGYFRDVLSILSLRWIHLPDGSMLDWTTRYANMLSAAVEVIGKQSNTVFLTVRDEQGRLPGMVPEYAQYLMKEKLAGDRYVVGSAPARENGTCPLCGADGETLYPNGVKGAGINLLNADRAGRFPGIDESQAWKAFPLCIGCADLLYIYKNHVLKKTGSNKDKRPYTSRIAGDAALILPYYMPGLIGRGKRVIDTRMNIYLNDLETDVETPEDDLLKCLQEQEGLLNIDILWATVGQNIDDVTGMISQVLPSRLRELSKLNSETELWQAAVFPQEEISNLRPNLTLQAFRELFWRPGGKKAKDINASRSVIELRRYLAYCIYHSRPAMDKQLWNEWLVTARWYFAEAISSADGYKRLLYEGRSKKGTYLTGAGWIKYFNWWINYLRKVGVMKMPKVVYQPKMEALKPYFTQESGVDSYEKAYAFLLGMLFGKLMEVQGAKNVNVSSNSLTWLRRLTLKGKNLPELYNKVRVKMLEYDMESSSVVRELLQDLGELGVKLGTNIDLDEIETNYFLLLGQSMSKTALKASK
ncbi:MAG: CRISPR-associated protein [Peptococcaceae bacterium]|nr:CRISPR-associated protein [Peptococcaceae bacterium]